MDDQIKKVIKKVKKGNQEAYREIIQQYQSSVYNICLRLVGNRSEAEDLAQEAFIRAYLKLDTYQQDKKFSTWLFRIATNVSIDYLRKKKPGVYLDAQIGDREGITLSNQLSSQEALPEEQVVQQEAADSLQDHISDLPEKYRAAIVLKYFEDLSLKEISAILDIPVATVKTRIHRGREALRQRLGHV